MSSLDSSFLREMHLFVAVARNRSFARAAASLKIPASTLSSRIAALEEGLGLRLLNRTTRTVELTEDGQVCLERVEHLVEDALNVVEELRERKSRPKGHLRISMPFSFADRLGVGWLAEFANEHPDITFDLDTSPSHVDIIADRYDLCIRLGTWPDSEFLVHRLAVMPMALFASPAYVERCGMPHVPEDLRDHDCVRISGRNFDNALVLSDGLASKSIRADGRFTLANPTLGFHLAIAGQTIAALVPFLCEQDIKEGRLVRILPSWTLPDIPLSAVTATKNMPARTRFFLDFLKRKLREIRMLGST